MCSRFTDVRNGFCNVIVGVLNDLFTLARSWGVGALNAEDAFSFNNLQNVLSSFINYPPNECLLHVARAVNAYFQDDNQSSGRPFR